MFSEKSNIFIQENVFESVVWKMAAILSRPQCVKEKWMSLSWELVWSSLDDIFSESIYIELGMNIHLIYNRGQNIFSAMITGDIDRYCLLH